MAPGPIGVSFSGKSLNIDGHIIELAWRIRSASADSRRVYVLFEPDAYLLDPNHNLRRKLGAPTVRNLIAVSRAGEPLWEAEFPEAEDYYYLVSSISPLVANSFSSYKRKIDRSSGAILSKQFFK